MQVQRGPSGAGQGPLVLAAPFELLAGVTDVELDAWRAIESVVQALEQVIEEALLKVAPVRGVEVGPVSVAVRLEPLLGRRRLEEPVEVSPGMNPLASPIRRREEGDR